MFLLTLPIRLALLVFFTLLMASSLMRRLVAGIVVSALIVASQHEQAFTALASAAGDDMSFAGLLTALAAFAGG